MAAGENQFHWLVTGDGQLGRSVLDVEDPEELRRYSEFHVDVSQRRRRRKRKQPDHDVIAGTIAKAASAAYRGKLVRELVTF